MLVSPDLCPSATSIWRVRTQNHYLQKTGISIEEATILPHEEILKEVEEFWEA